MSMLWRAWSALGARLSLRARLFLGMLIVALAATAAFAIAMDDFVETLEDELLNQTLKRELDGLVMDYRSGVAIAGDRGRAAHVYVGSARRPPPGLPDAFRTIDDGDYGQIHRGATEYFVARRDVDTTPIYLVLDVAEIESLEHRLSVLGWLTVAATILLTLLIAGVFAYLILRPVRGLAARLAVYQPGQAHRPIAAQYPDRDMRRIAHSFDELIVRFDAAIEREQTFTEDTGHELRTPLAVALSANELLLQQPDLPPKARERVERIQTACLRMQRLVFALLFLAREQQPHPEHCDVAEVLEELLPFYRPEFKRKGLSINVSCEPAPVAAPAGIVDCVLHNLLENALEHTENGHVIVTVDPCRLTIVDTGRGISEQALEHVFDRRYRGPESRGLGIGLYLVRRICERLGWPIQVTSPAGCGTRFDIDLQRAPSVSLGSSSV